jgi:hypothetical protein
LLLFLAASAQSLPHKPLLCRSTRAGYNRNRSVLWELLLAAVRPLLSLSCQRWGSHLDCHQSIHLTSNLSCVHPTDRPPSSDAVSFSDARPELLRRLDAQHREAAARRIDMVLNAAAGGPTVIPLQRSSLSLVPPEDRGQADGEAGPADGEPAAKRTYRKPKAKDVSRQKKGGAASDIRLLGLCCFFFFFLVWLLKNCN